MHLVEQSWLLNSIIYVPCKAGTQQESPLPTSFPPQVGHFGSGTKYKCVHHSFWKTEVN